jgi:transposase
MENELKTNAVRLSQAQQYELRKGIIRLSKSGKSNPEIAEILDVSLRHVQNTKKLYAKNGIAAIKPKTRGRRIGAKRTLSPEQEREIQRTIVDNTPERLRFKKCMWTRSNIHPLLLQKIQKRHASVHARVLLGALAIFRPASCETRLLAGRGEGEKLGGVSAHFQARQSRTRRYIF